MSYLSELAPPTPARYLRKAWVRSVHDGDTIRVDIDLGFGHRWMGEDGQGVSLRLWGLNAPERHGEEAPAGLTSRDALRAILPPATEIVLETIRDHTEKYGRYLAILWLPGEPHPINAYLLRVGLAQPYLP